jgi:hypothetical protein
MYGNGANCTINGYEGVKFQGAEQNCVPCEWRHLCLCTPEEKMTGLVTSFPGKRRDTTVEPVFGNLRYNKRLSRFTLRGKVKVDGQFKLYAMMHNIEKLAGNGYAQ